MSAEIFNSWHFSRWSAHGVPPPLAPTRLGYGDVSLAPLRALRQSPSTLWLPHVHVVSPPWTCQQPWPLRPEISMHSWSAHKTQLRLSLSPPHSELLPTRQGDAHHSITYRDEVDRRVFAHPAQSLSEKTSTIGCSACLLYTTKHLGLPFRNRT